MTTATLTLRVPEDLDAEQELAGCAIAGVGVARRLLDEMDEFAFYDPRVRRVIVAAADLVDGSRSVDADVDLIAARAGVDASEVRRWVDSRTVMFDLAGVLQRRVMGAAERRWEAYALAERLLEVAA